MIISSAVKEISIVFPAYTRKIIQENEIKWEGDSWSDPSYFLEAKSFCEKILNNPLEINT